MCGGPSRLSSCDDGLGTGWSPRKVVDSLGAVVVVLSQLTVNYKVLGERSDRQYRR